MNASLTDRYVTATVRDLDDDQRAEVERELRTTIEDMIDGRLEAGAPSRPEAERAVLAELGDPVRLAAGYSGRPLYLIGPRVYPQWRRVMTVLLTTLVPLVTAVNLVVRLFVDDVATEGVGPAVVAALWVGFMVAVNVVFWVTVVFALAERGRVATGVELEWDPDQLPDDDGTGRVGPGRDRGLGRLPRRRRARARLAADQLAGDQRRRPRAGARPGAVVRGAAVAAPRARRARRSSPSWSTAGAAGRPRSPSRTSRSTSRSRCRCSCCCGHRPVQPGVRRRARRGRVGRRRARPHRVDRHRRRRGAGLERRRDAAQPAPHRATAAQA